MPTETSQTLKKAFALLDCFTLQRPELGVREAARLLDISSSSAGRLLTSMRNLGVLKQDPETKNYSLGGRVMAWYGVYNTNLDVREQALPYLEALQKECGETISLYVLEGNERVCVERLESSKSVRIVQRVGRRLPLYAGSAGKVFLAFLSEERQKEILDQTVFKALTEKTIIDLETLKTELAKIREQGFAVSVGEWLIDASGVAAPIFNQKSEIEAVLTISGPGQRFTEEKISDYSQQVTRVASQISRDLGFIQRNN
jgi:DNA-binding IclR family transcriptional regulator